MSLGPEAEQSRDAPATAMDTRTAAHAAISIQPDEDQLD